MRNTYAILAVLTLALLLAACQTTGTTARPSPKAAAALSTADLMREADDAFAARQYDTSELYYSRLAKRQDLSNTQATEVYGKLARSAVEAGHHNNGFMALSQWAASDHTVNDSAEYFSLALEIYHRLGMRGEMAQLTDRLLRDDKLTWDVRAKGGVTLASILFEDGEPAKALGVLSGFYSMAKDAAGRAEMERAFLRQLRDDPWNAELAAAVTPENIRKFPYAIIAFEDANRVSDEEASWGRSWKIMRQVLAESELVEKGYMRDVLSGLEHDNGQPTLSIALAVPISGKYQSVGRKIASGTAAAQWMLANYGVELEVKVINTDAPGWTERIASLPPHYALVGGPVRVSAYKELDASGAMAGRALFSFLSSLPEGVEGSRAWRFFPSRRDEVRSLADMAVNQLGINRVAVLSPDEPYGSKMSALFRQEAAALGAEIVSVQSYPPKDHPQWGRRVAELLDVPARFDKEAPLPAPKFGAVFLPDNWSQAQLMIPNFFFYDASDLVFLGPDPWSRALDKKGTTEKYFNNAICPGAWWDGGAEAMRLQDFLTQEGLGKADFWVALGYDWLQLAADLGVLPSGWDAREVNNRLTTLGDMSFAMAPISWDQTGQARQRLYRFTPTETGKDLANVDAIIKSVNWAKTKRERRLKTYEETKRAEAASKKNKQ